MGRLEGCDSYLKLLADLFPSIVICSFSGFEFLLWLVLLLFVRVFLKRLIEPFEPHRQPTNRVGFACEDLLCSFPNGLSVWPGLGLVIWKPVILHVVGGHEWDLPIATPVWSLGRLHDFVINALGKSPCNNIGGLRVGEVSASQNLLGSSKYVKQLWLLMYFGFL